MPRMRSRYTVRFALPWVTESFHHLLFLSGTAVLKTASGSYPVKKGDSVLLPAGLGEYTVTGTGAQYIATRADEKLC